MRDPIGASFTSHSMPSSGRSCFPDSELNRTVPGANSRERAILEESVADYWALALPNDADQVVRTLRPRVQFGEVTLAAAARRLAMRPRTRSALARGGHDVSQIVQRAAVRGRRAIAARHAHRRQRNRLADVYNRAHRSLWRRVRSPRRHPRVCACATAGASRRTTLAAIVAKRLMEHLERWGLSS